MSFNFNLQPFSAGNISESTNRYTYHDETNHITTATEPNDKNIEFRTPPTNYKPCAGRGRPHPGDVRTDPYHNCLRDI